MKFSLPRTLMVALAALAVSTASAQTSDGRTVSLIIPFQAGGQLDLLGRHIADALGTRLGVRVIAENKPGAAGTIAANQVAKSAPDGKTLFLTTGAAITIAPHLRTGMLYDAERDLAPLAMVADMPMALAVRADSPYQNVADVLKDAKARPGQIAVATTGVGAISHLTGELFSQATATRFVFVPYQGVESIRDLVGGQVPLIISSSIALEPHVKSKQVRVLATFSRNRLSSAGGAPTMTEATGITGLEPPVWTGVMAPAGLSSEMSARLSQEVLAICQQPEIQKLFQEIIVCEDTQSFAKIIREDSERWKQTIRRAGLKLQ